MICCFGNLSNPGGFYFLILMINEFFYMTSLGRCTCQKIRDLPGYLVAEIFARLSSNRCCLLTIWAALKDWRQFMGNNAFRKLTLWHNSGKPFLGFFTNSFEDSRFIMSIILTQPCWKNCQCFRIIDVDLNLHSEYMSWHAALVGFYLIVLYLYTRSMSGI
jgi:hypothetical protein